MGRGKRERRETDFERVIKQMDLLHSSKSTYYFSKTFELIQPLTDAYSTIVSELIRYNDLITLQ